jgi:type I restriction enzyme M protein
MDNTKETERAELHKTIWRIANDLRGSVDGWDFKTYVLGMLFYRFISENLTAYLNVQERKAWHPDFDYARLSDADADFGRIETVKEKGFYILPSHLFANVRQKARNDANLNETLSRVFTDIEGSATGADSEDDIKGLFDDLDVNSSKLGPTVAKRNEKLVKLLDAIGDLPLGNSGDANTNAAGSFSDNTIDLFGDAYEYLMQMYASTAGKSGGEFYTPQEVSELLARITVVGKTEVNKVYDPACGSGSLLLKFAKVLGHDQVRQGFFGQEVNLTTFNLCRINMFLHDVNYEKFHVAHGDTLTDPAHWDDEPFEAIVSNPPYSIKWDGDANPLLINDPRFAPAGVLAPKSKADLAFTLHILSWLAVNGTAAIVEFPGVLYRGGAEQKIRKYLIDNNYVDTVIQLPPDLFFGTTIATCIIVLKKSKHDNATLFIDASAEFTRSGNKNKLTAAHQRKVLDAFTARKGIDHFARLVDNREVAANGYNIAVSSYVEQRDTSVTVDIQALNVEIARIVARQAELRTAIDAIVADLEGKRDALLGFNEKAVRWATLGEVGTFTRGRRFTKDDYVPDGIGCIHYGDIYTQYGTSAMKTVSHVRTDMASTLRFAKPGDIVIASVGETVEDVGKAVAWLGADEVAVHDDCFTFRHSMNPKFVSYYFQTKAFHAEKNKFVARAKVKRLSGEDLAKLAIPVPPLDEQQRIVAILDQFDVLVNDLSIGLPGELQARRHQYQHYRDRLLSFRGAA